MLGDEFNKIKQVQLSKSSILQQEMNEKQLKELLDEKDRTIRQLKNKIDRLEEQLKRFQSDKNIRKTNNDAEPKQNMHLKLLKQEISKSKRLQEIVVEITERVNLILDDLSSDNTITQNSQELREVIQMLQTSKNPLFHYDSQSNDIQVSLNISDEWNQKIDILEGAFKSYKLKFKALNSQYKTLTTHNEALQKKVCDLEAKVKDNEEVRQLSLQLKQQKKQKEKIKKLLQITQYSKNQLINKINSVTLREDIRAKTKEELLDYSKELNFRIRDLEKEKACILKQTTKDKQQDLRKYQEFLKKLKTIKEKSILAKSYA